MAERIKDQRPLLVPPPGADLGAYVSLAARLGVPLVVSGADLNALATAAMDATRAGVGRHTSGTSGADLRDLHHSLSAIRRGALDRNTPRFWATLSSCGIRPPREFEKAVLGITKFASLLTIADHGGEPGSALDAAARTSTRTAGSLCKCSGRLLHR